MPTRRFSAAAAALCFTTQAWATPEDFDFFLLEASVGVGGDINDEPLDSDFDIAFIASPSADVVEIDLTSGDRTLFSRISYDVSVVSTPSSLLLSASFDARGEIAFGPFDSSGFVQAFAAFDAFSLAFTLDEPQLLTLSHGPAFLDSLDGGPSIGEIPAGVTEIPAGQYELNSLGFQSLFDVGRSPSDGNGVFSNLLEFSVGLTAVPTPSGAALLAISGLGLARRRR